MPILREGPGVTILGVRSLFIATEQTRVGSVEYGPEGIKGVKWRRASSLDLSPPAPPAVQVEAIVVEFDGIRVETSDPAILSNLHDPEWRKKFARINAGPPVDMTVHIDGPVDPEDTAA